MKKKGMEVSVNFLVMLIMAIIVFAFGIVFLRNVIKTSEDVVNPMTKQLEDELYSRMDSGEIVVVPLRQQTIAIGKHYTFGIGILNQLQRREDFMIYTTFATAIDEDTGKEFEQSYLDSVANNIKQWTFPSYEPRSIQNNDQYIENLPFQVPKGARHGTYVFNVNACYGGEGTPDDIKCPGNYPNLYDYTHQIRIIVK